VPLFLNAIDGQRSQDDRGIAYSTTDRTSLAQVKITTQHLPRHDMM